MPDPTLEQRVARLEDIEAIRQLKARYCAGCDDDHNPESLVPLFATDAVWEASGIARCEGHDEIRNYFATLRASGRIRNSAHNVSNPNIEVNGDSASGHWRLVMLYAANTPDGGVQYQRIIGWYRERYVRLDGAWKFQHLYCEVEDADAYPTEASRLG